MGVSNSTSTKIHHSAIEFFTHETNGVASVQSMIAGFILLFGLVSFLIKERFFLSDSLVATFVGVAFGPQGLKFFDPLSWKGDINETTFHFCDLVISIQIMSQAIALPRKFWGQNWKTLIVLLGPITTFMWLSTAAIFHFFLGISVYNALLIASCCAPTDPILANSIVNGRFAELHVKKHIRDIMAAESALNDGAVLPFFQLALLLLKYSPADALGKWASYTLLYSLLGGAVLGSAIGLTARYALKLSDNNDLIDKKSFLVWEIAMALFSSGVASVFHLASFVAVLFAGITFAWDGWFAEETKGAHVPEVIDMLVNVTFFIYFGSIIPWQAFGDGVIPLWKLAIATALIFIVRRLPAIIACMHYASPVFTLPEACFVGWFGPVGVGALWYWTDALEYFPEYADEFGPLVMFIVLVNVIVHGLMPPFVHLGRVAYSSANNAPMDKEFIRSDSGP